MTRFPLKSALILLLGIQSAISFADPIAVLLKDYEDQAKKADKAFSGFNADRGKKFFLAEVKSSKGETISCATCHTTDPKKSGKTKAGKAIDPMAVSANNKRYTDKQKTEKWFKRNCKDVYNRECTPLEKGDFITYMKSE